MKKSFSRNPTFNININTGRAATKKSYRKHVKKKHRKHFKPKRRASSLPWNFQKPSYQKGLSWNLQSSMKLPHHKTLYGNNYPHLTKGANRQTRPMQTQKFLKTAAPYARPAAKIGAKVAVGGAKVVWRIGKAIGGRISRKAAPTIGKIERKIVPTHTGIKEMAATAQSAPSGPVYGRKNLP